MKVAVCELEPEMQAGSAAWRALADRVSAVKPDLLLLSEMPFGRWIAAGERPDPAVFEDACRVHEQGLAHFEELGAAVVLATRPLHQAGRRINDGFVWTRSGGPRPAHSKQYFPDEEGYHEARWFEAGERHFRAAQAGAARVGFLICTEVMFNEHARHYGRQGAQLIVVPRAVGPESLSRWQVAMRMAAIVSGCYVLSSNRVGRDARGQVFGGHGWLVDPRGDVVGETSQASPVAFCDLDLDAVRRAQSEYPCYVPELP